MSDTAEKDAVFSSSNTEDLNTADLKTEGDGGVILVPQPSDDARDPLNWSLARKTSILATLCLAMFVGFSAPFCGQLNLIQQSQLYHKTTVQITYFNSAASAGLATGGYIWWPLSHKFGRSSVIFWCMLGVLAAQIWAPLMTRHDQYVPYLLSRFFAAFFGTVVAVLGPRYLVDMFFLHRRGRAFTALHLALNFGASAGPTFSGFVAMHSYWPVEYWWHVALTAVTLIPILFFLEDTTFDRTPGAVNRSSAGFFKDRIDTFFFGTKVVPHKSWGEVVTVFFRPFKFFIAPVMLIIAGFDTISFGFYVALNALTPVWLQLPKKAGGIYGFTVGENAAFTFVHWVGFLFGWVYGQLLSDRVPMWLARRSNGLWKPEYRLHILWPTNFVLMPLGLGLVGIALEYKLNWGVLVVGQLFVTIGSMVSIPVTVNYICECFRQHTTEVTLVLNSMRLFLGLSINFYINPWVHAVGIGWVYGMMAFFCVFAFLFLVLLMIWGHRIREITPFFAPESEEGERIVKGRSAESI